MKKLLILIFLISAQILWAQTNYPLNSQNNGQTFTTCEGIFTDDGGANSNYSNNQNRTITFCPGEADSVLQFDFTMFSLEDGWDELEVFDGSTATGTPLHVWTGNLGMFTFITPTPGNCVTFRFTSDGSVNDPGWLANFYCPCPVITPSIDSTNPAVEDDVIKICKGETVDFTGSATFEDSGVGATYQWDFGNGSTATGQSVSTTFEEGGVYVVNFIVTDSEGCSASISQVVQVSSEPEFEFTSASQEICLGESLDITANVTPTTHEYDCTPPVSETMFLPDGSGVSYSTSVIVDCYPGEVLTDISQIESVCFNMEHSYAGDLDIVLVAPNGSQVVLFEQAGGSTNFGIPWATGTVDGQSSNLTAGVGYQYCIIPGNTYQTIEESEISGVQFPNGDGPGTYTDKSYPAGNYSAISSFNALLGTPLNGEWTIIITDNLSADNGYIFEWSIDIEQVPGIYSFTADIDAQEWNPDPTITNINSNIITVTPTTEGTHCYTYTVTDSFGCTYEEEYCIEVNSGTAEFNLNSAYCLNSTPDPLPLVSTNGVTGTWSPATIDTSTLGITTYTFTADPGQCAVEFTIDIEITEGILPVFDIENVICLGIEAPILPSTSNDGIMGTWNPSVIDTSNEGTTTYTFTPDAEEECALPTTIEIQVAPGLSLLQPPLQTLCDDNLDGIYITNLTELNGQLLNDPSTANFIYYATQNNMENGISIPSNQWANYQFDSLPASIWVTAANSEGCRSEAIEVQFIAGQEIQHNSVSPMEYCEGEILDILTYATGIPNETGVNIEFYTSLINAQNETNPIPDPTAFEAQGNGSVFVRLDKEGSCSVVVELPYVQRISPEILNVPAELVLCEGLDVVDILAESDDLNATYLWSWGDNQSQSGAAIQISETGTYTLTVTGSNTCVSTHELIVKPGGEPTITSIESGDDYLIVFAHAGNGGTLEYSLNGVLWQTNPRFDNLVKGETYTVYVREDGCLVKSHTAVILNVPNFISPNGDGYNDLWEIRGIDATPTATIKIFDRYGKIFVDTNFEGNYIWDGKYLGRSLPSGDCWYILDVPSDGVSVARKFVGHISIRN